MTTVISVRRTIAAPLDVVWDLLVTTERWPAWGLTVSDHDGPARIDGTSRGRVRTVVGITLQYEITEFEPKSRWRWKVAGVPATGHSVEAAPDGSTIVTFEIPAWAFAYHPVVWWSLRTLAREASRIQATNQAEETAS